jgi:hypothetical protein
MSQGQDPVSDDEQVLRRVHKSHYDASLSVAIHFAAFRPSKQDTSGLSVFREKYISAAEVAAASRKPQECFVVRLLVSTLRDLKLSVIAEEDPVGLPGHAVIPELSVTAYGEEKKRLKDILVELSRLASSAIVHEPAQ